MKTEKDVSVRASVDSQVNAGVIGAEVARQAHDSDCATHNEPALPSGHCDCLLTLSLGSWADIENYGEKFVDGFNAGLSAAQDFNRRAALIARKTPRDDLRAALERIVSLTPAFHEAVAHTGLPPVEFNAALADASAALAKVPA